MIEKHVTLDPAMAGPDHAASLAPDDFKRMVAGIRAVEAALGDGRKMPRPCEADVALVARRSLFTARPVAAGATIAPADLIALRPAGGIAPDQFDGLIGRRWARALPEGARIAWEDVGA